MRISGVIARVVLSAAAATAAVAVEAGQAWATPLPAAIQSRACATLKVTASPKINAQNAPYETIRNKVTNCAATIETVTLKQHITGPYASTGTVITSPKSTKTWTITLRPGQTVDKIQHIPYSCCGTYQVSDSVYNRSGRLLAHATTSFTFA